MKGEASDESLLSGLGQSDQDLVSPGLGIRSRIVCRQVLLHPMVVLHTTYLGHNKTTVDALNFSSLQS